MGCPFKSTVMELIMLKKDCLILLILYKVEYRYQRYQLWRKRLTLELPKEERSNIRCYNLNLELLERAVVSIIEVPWSYCVVVSLIDNHSRL